MSEPLPLPSACASCGAELPSTASFCPACGAATADVPPLETVRGPVARQAVQRRWFGVPAGILLLCAGFATFGAAIGLFASGHWPWGLVLLGVAAALLTAVAERSRRVPASPLAERSAVLVADGRARASSAGAVLRIRLESQVARRRSRAELERIEDERALALRALGAAVLDGDEVAERQARSQLAELAERRARVDRELALHGAEAERRIRAARLPVEATMMVAPSEPYPPPDEGDPPEPARIPEPSPPPDEGTPPEPAPQPDER
jgi:zinc-ribbon domain